MLGKLAKGLMKSGDTLPHFDSLLPVFYTDLHSIFPDSPGDSAIFHVCLVLPGSCLADNKTCADMSDMAYMSSYTSS